MSSSMDEASDGEGEALQDSSQGSPLQAFQSIVADRLQASSDAQGSGSTDQKPAPSHSSSEESEDERENRFQGPDSTWRKHTAEERGLAASLDQQRANDLSVHLYNAHALKARLRDPRLAAAAKPWQSKRSWLGRDDQSNVPWHPDPQWTAWPLPADEVPRSGETFGVSPLDADDDGTYKKIDAWRPSANLEDELQALVLKKAKERFRQRHWATEDDSNGTIQQGQGVDTSSESDDPDVKSSVLPQASTVTPALLADDDRADVITRPPVRHILTKLEDLLKGLHVSRKGHHIIRSRSRSRSRSKPAASRSRSRTKDSAKPSTKGKARRSSLGSVDTHSDDAVGEDGEDIEMREPRAPESEARSPSRQPTHKLGQRDWSEVLGMASLVGWDQAVVDRAARRCASLFGEGMAFRTMPETAVNSIDDTVIEYKADMKPLLDDESQSDSEESLEAPLPPTYFCPFEDCPRAHDAYPKAWRWREHLRKKHKLSAEQVRDIEGQQMSISPDPNSPAAAGSSSGVDDGLSSAVEDNSESDMEGGVHVDGFLQPIKATAVGRGKDLKIRRRKRDLNNTGEGSAKRLKPESPEDGAVLET